METVAGFILLLTVLSSPENMDRQDEDWSTHLGLGAATLTQEGGITTRLGVDYRHRWVLMLGRTGHTRNSKGVSAPYHYGYIARNFQMRQGKRIQPFARIGLAYLQDAPRNALGCNFQHVEGVGIEFWNTLTLGYDHFSSAGRCEPNSGVDQAYLGFRFYF